MDSEVIERGQSIFEKLAALNFADLTLMDLIYAVGVITLIVLACKITKKFFKVILVLLAIGLVLYWLWKQGIFAAVF